MNIDDILPSTEQASPATVAAGQHLNEALAELLTAAYRDGARCALQRMAEPFAENPGQILMAGQVAAILLDGAETLAKEGA